MINKSFKILKNFKKRTIRNLKKKIFGGGLEPKYYNIARSGNQEELEKALKNSDLNINDKISSGITAGYTMLMAAAGADKEQTVKFLLDNNADVNITNNKGKTALDIARDKGYNNIVEILNNYKAPSTPSTPRKKSSKEKSNEKKSDNKINKNQLLEEFKNKLIDIIRPNKYFEFIKLNLRSNGDLFIDFKFYHNDGHFTIYTSKGTDTDLDNQSGAHISIKTKSKFNFHVYRDNIFKYKDESKQFSNNQEFIKWFNSLKQEQQIFHNNSITAESLNILNEHFNKFLKDNYQNFLDNLHKLSGGRNKTKKHKINRNKTKRYK